MDSGRVAFSFLLFFSQILELGGAKLSAASSPPPVDRVVRLRGGSFFFPFPSLFNRKREFGIFRLVIGHPSPSLVEVLFNPPPLLPCGEKPNTDALLARTDASFFSSALYVIGSVSDLPLAAHSRLTYPPFSPFSLSRGQFKGSLRAAPFLSPLPSSYHNEVISRGQFQAGGLCARPTFFPPAIDRRDGRGPFSFFGLLGKEVPAGGGRPLSVIALPPLPPLWFVVEFSFPCISFPAPNPEGKCGPEPA